MEAWIQFAMLMITLLAIAIRNEHRMTMLEGELKTEKAIQNLLWKRIEKLEDRHK
jgi:hypothetical protein